MNIMNNRTIKSTIVFVFLLSASILFAQPGGGGGGQGGGGAPPSTGAPIDGGAVGLVAGIAGYAYKKFKAEKEK